MIIIKILRLIFFYIFFFNTTSLITFRTVINILTTHLQALSTRNILRLFWDSVIHNRLSENIALRLVTLPFGVNLNSLSDTNPKKFFWVGFTFTLIIYKQYLLFKKLFLWPFKAGVFLLFFLYLELTPVDS